MKRFIITDIEGTTTDIDFVHKILFPYSRERLASYVHEHQNEPHIQEALLDVKKTLLDEAGKADSSVLECIAALESWIDQDRKHPALKAIQGHIWQSGYKSGAYKGHVYEDVPSILRVWQERGYTLSVYSSGSVKAQKLLFSHSSFGDITGFFSHFFDTAVGAKKESKSYTNILEKLHAEDPSEVYFLSDILDELNAAKKAGLNPILLDRSHQYSQPEVDGFPVAKDFKEVDQILRARSN